MGAELPRGLAAALETDLSEFPAASQVDDLTNRLAPLLESATAAAAVAIPAGLLAPKAPLSLAGTLKLLTVKWGSTVILPMVIGAASGGVAWEVREATRSSDVGEAVSAHVTDGHRSAAPSRGKTARQELSAPGEIVGEERQAVGTITEPVVPLTEIELIDRAQRALAHQPAVARQWVDEHMRRFPEGTFVQEREAVAIEALVREGRMVEARTRAIQFRTRFPESAYLRRIEAWLRSPRTQESESK
jgi:hypothetical protein